MTRPLDVEHPFINPATTALVHAQGLDNVSAPLHSVTDTGLLQTRSVETNPGPKSFAQLSGEGPEGFSGTGFSQVQPSQS